VFRTGRLRHSETGTSKATHKEVKRGTTQGPERPRDINSGDPGANVPVTRGRCSRASVGCLASTPFIRHSYIGLKRGFLVMRSLRPKA
jgi:hypothetical protein